MDRAVLQELKDLLEAKRDRLQNELTHFTRKDSRVAGDYDAAYPQFSPPNGGRVDEASEADELEEYSNRVPVEHALEKDLAAVHAALRRIEAGTYGRCRACVKEIPLERLRIVPEAETCGCQ